MTLHEICLFIAMPRVGQKTMHFVIYTVSEQEELLIKVVG